MPPAELRFVKNGKMLAWLHRRQEYCDRGRYDAHVEVNWISNCDPWPRYYFNHVYGMSEIEEYLKAKKIDIYDANWVVYETPEQALANSPYAYEEKVD